MDHQEFFCAGSSRVMPDEVFAGIFEKAGQEWRLDPTTKAKVVQYRRIGAEAWIYGGLRSHYRVQPNGGFCAKFPSAQKALQLCFLLEVE